VEGERKQTARRALLTQPDLLLAGGVPAAISALGGKRAAAAAGLVGEGRRPPTMGQKTSQFSDLGDNIFVINQQ